jgi:hypothetical protein
MTPQFALAEIGRAFKANQKTPHERTASETLLRANLDRGDEGWLSSIYGC